MIYRKVSGGYSDMTGKNSVIHRKAQFARQEFDARGMSMSKALRVALARVADRHYDLPLVVSTVEQVAASHAKLRDHFEDEGLLALLGGPDRLAGAICLDTQFLTALIEMQTMGHVRQTAAQRRPVTRTDAAISAPFIDRFLETAHSQLADASPKLAGYRFDDMVEDARALTLAMDAPDYAIYKLTVDLHDGAKSGLMTVILPVDPVGVAKGGGDHIHAEKTTQEGLGDVARNAPVTLNAVLDRLEMPLRDACKLQVGMRFPIAPNALADAQLTATGGYVVAGVVLGQVNGFRAARLVSGRNGQLPTGVEAQVPMPPSEQRHLEKETGLSNVTTDEEKPSEQLDPAALPEMVSSEDP
ncbi:FliM/FliN family flagellar motor switch protein [Roseovarius sp. MMSF_3281]|uniref:FliM/FliN family flagellar motor switch protein n=1 Tax=Roseovarius sp. MMSF_3281 TaxID=3046694 RepID=UPI003531E918